MAAKKARDLTLREAQALQAYILFGKETASQIFGLAEGELQGIFEAAGLSDEQVTLLEEQRSLRGNLLSFFSENPDSLPPALREIRETSQQVINTGLNIASGTTPEQNERRAVASEISANRGATATTATIKDRGFDLLNTGGQAGANELIDAQRTAGDVVSTGGFTPQLQEVFDTAKGIIASGGRDDDLIRLRETGLALVQSGGFTPELQNLLSQAQAQIASFGGMTPEMRQVFDSAMQIVQAQGEGGGLLPTDQVIQFAREEAANAINQQAGRAIREARLRGGSEAALVAGAAGRPLAEFADQAAEAQASATRQALVQQQNLKIENFRNALNAASGVAQAAAEREIALTSSANALIGDIARSASSNLSAGFQAAIGAEGIAADRFKTGVQAAVQATGVAAQNFSSALQGVADIGRIFAQREALGAQLVLGAEELEFNRLGLAQNLFAGLTQEQLAGGNLALAGNAQQQGLAGLLLGGGLQSAGLSADIAQSGQGNFLGGLGILGNFVNPFLGFSGNALGLQAGLFGQAAQFQAQPGFLHQLGLATIPGVVAGAAGAGAGALFPPFGGGGAATQSPINFGNTFGNIFTGGGTPFTFPAAS